MRQPPAPRVWPSSYTLTVALAGVAVMPLFPTAPHFEWLSIAVLSGKLLYGAFIIGLSVGAIRLNRRERSAEARTQLERDEITDDLMRRQSEQMMLAFAAHARPFQARAYPPDSPMDRLLWIAHEVVMLMAVRWQTEPPREPGPPNPSAVEAWIQHLAQTDVLLRERVLKRVLENGATLLEAFPGDATLKQFVDNPDDPRAMNWISNYLIMLAQRFPDAHSNASDKL